MEKCKADFDYYFHHGSLVCFLFRATSHGIWLKNILFELRVLDSSSSRPLKLYCKNSSTIFMVKNNKSEVKISILTLNTYP